MSCYVTHAMSSIIFSYPIFMLIENVNINYIQLPTKDDNNVKLMFYPITQIPSSNSIGMY